MAEFVEFPLETEPDALAQLAFDFLQSKIPDWEPHDGQFEVWLIESLSQMAAEVRDVAADMPVSIFKFMGEKILRLPPFNATQAVGTSTWTMVDNAGYTIPAGTNVSLPGDGEDVIGFSVLEDVVVAPGATVTGTGEVQLLADEEGAAGSGLTGPIQLIDILDFVDGPPVLEGVTTDGQDEEDEDAYLVRLAARMELLTDTPILAPDFARVVRNNIAEVARATAIDNYNADTATAGVERCVTVAVQNSAGDASSSGVKAAAKDLLESLRESSFLIFIIDPSYNLINVTVQAKALPGYDTAAVAASLTAGINEFLSPARWGRPNFGDQPEWVNIPTVRYLELSTAINEVEGVDYIEVLTFAKQGSGLGTTNVTMTGVVPLPKPNTINVTVD